uniref:Uncharacterized protein n=1 Tax=Strigamia maritima TaxID=126957 RepID=T1IIK2_STRMM
MAAQLAAVYRKCFQLLVLIGGITAMSGILVITREVVVRQLFGTDYISAEKYQSLLLELENISRAVLTVESQAVTLSQDLELLKRSARHILSQHSNRTNLSQPPTV